MDNRVIGILGGGQLGRMMSEAAHRLEIKVVTLDSKGAPAKQINASDSHVEGSFKDPEAIRALANRCNVLTTEIEHVNVDALKELETWSDEAQAHEVDIQPSWKTIEIIQDKYLQKQHLARHTIATAGSRELSRNSLAEFRIIEEELGVPFMLKSRTEAYDGRGNFPVHSENDFLKALQALDDKPLYAERWIDFRQELAVMIVKTEDKPSDKWHLTTKAFPVVETIHENSICKLVYAPARGVTGEVVLQAQELARKAIASFWGKGVFGVEMFLMKDMKLMVNEIAPRPHNSGHYTIEACPVSQYEAHLRAILDLPINENNLQQDRPAIMLNILGGQESRSHIVAVQEASKIDGVHVHLYGKGDARPGRKMGHVTLTAKSMAIAELRMEGLINTVDAMRDGRYPVQDQTLNDRTRRNLRSSPAVAITMGSESDREVLRPGIQLLADLKIPHHVTITSAHRTPELMFRFAREAKSQGYQVIIAAAGGAAHLPGMIAALTSLPVIGLPVKTSTLDGWDSLLSIAQMPRGCPVATVAVNNSVNAAQLAIRILAISDQQISQNLDFYLANQTRSVEDQAAKMDSGGFHAYGQGP